MNYLITTMRRVLTTPLTLLILYLYVAGSLAHSTSRDSNDVKYFISQSRKPKTPMQHLFDIADNRDMDVDALKRAKITNFPSVKIRKSIHKLKKSFNSKREYIGKPVGPTDSYMNLGDGIYLKNDENDSIQNAKNNAQSIMSALPTYKITATDLKNRDHALNAVAYTSKLETFPEEEEYSKMKDVSANESMQHNALDFEGNGNIEGISAGEVSMIKNIENNLNVDDKITSKNMRSEAEASNKKLNQTPSEYQKALKEGRDELNEASSSEKHLYKKDKTGDSKHNASREDSSWHEIHLFSNSSKSSNENPIKESFLRSDKESQIFNGDGSTVTLHYEDIDIDADDGYVVKGKVAKNMEKPLKIASNNTTSQHVSGNKNARRKARKRNSKNKRGRKTSLKKKNNSLSLKVDSKQNAGLFSILNKTENQNLKHHIKPNQPSQKTADKKDTKVIGVTGAGGVQIDFFIDNGKSSKANSADTSQERKVKSDVENDDNYVSSSRIPEISTGFFPQTPTTEESQMPYVDQQPPQQQQRESLDLNSNGQSFATIDNQPLMLQARPPVSLESREVTAEHKDGNELKLKNADMEDAIADFNSAEIKNAMADSDLKGLTQIKSAVDDQNTKNAVEYFEQPSQNMKNKSETTLGELSEEFKEAEKEFNGHSKTEGSSEKVKIVVHIPDEVSKDKEDKTAIDAIKDITEKARKMFSNKHIKEETEEKGSKKDGSKALEAASMIEKLIAQDSIGMDDYKPTEKNIQTQSVVVSDILGTTKNVEGKTAINDETIENILNSPAFRNYFSKPTESSTTTPTKAITTSSLKSPTHAWTEVAKFLKTFRKEESVVNPNVQPIEQMDTYKAFIKSMHEDALTNDKLQGSEGTMESFTKGTSNRLRIHGGKVIGGSVRGGSIFGGVISGGDVSGGEIKGGKVSGGLFKNGVLMNGEIKNGVVEGGTILGGEVLGGLIKSGEIDGGIVRGGIIEGGHLVNGSIEGGVFKGGEIDGGRLISGEIDGGLMKGGEVSGGTLKGGVIESGRLEGGLMLDGILRGGVVKSGIIRGGIIDKGVVVQDDAEIGPGVEIHSGVVKGGKITASRIPQDIKPTSKQKKRMEEPTVSLLDIARRKDRIKNGKDRSNIMYHIQLADSNPNVENVIPASGNKNVASNRNTKPVITAISDSTKVRYLKPVPKSIASTFRINNGIKAKPALDEIQKLNNIHSYKKTYSNPSLRSQYKNVLASKRQLQQQVVQQYAQPTEENELTKSDEDTVHWALTESVRGGVVEGDTPSSPKLRASADGVSFHNGHAILDGESGFFDAGDYRGKCLSDPDVCLDGFTFHLTLKIYGDSVKSTKKLFILDSGAVNKDSRGLSIWVVDGKIKALVSTRKEVACVSKDFAPYTDEWVVMTLTWRKDKGAQMYINCELFDDNRNHYAIECEPQCPDCHQMDVATRLMFGRPNKGPHFKVTRMALGDIAIFEKYHDQDEVNALCGIVESPITTTSAPPTLPQIQQSPQQPTTQAPQQPPSNQQSSENPPQSPESDEPTQPSQLHPQIDVPVLTTTTAQPTVVEPQHQSNQQREDFLRPQAQQVSRLVQQAHDHMLQLVSKLKPTLTRQSPNSQLAGRDLKQMHAPAVHDQASSRSSHPNAPVPRKSQYPSPPVTMFKNEKPDVDIRKDNATMNAMKKEILLYPTPPGLMKRHKPHVTEAPTPLIDYATDRRSHMYRKQFGESTSAIGFTQWSGWSPCTGKCGDGIQTSTRSCQNSDCSEYGNTKRFRRCKIKNCTDERGSKKSAVSRLKRKHSIAFNGQQESAESLVSELNRLKH